MRKSFDLQDKPPADDLLRKTAELSRLNADFILLKGCFTELAQDLNKYQGDPEELEGQIQIMEDESNKLKEKISELQDERDSCLERGKFSKKAVEFSALESRLQSLENQGFSLESMRASLERDHHLAIARLKQSLQRLQKDKAGVNESLAQQLEKLNQLLEKKAMLKEDLTGRLLQRAEAIARREELEQLLEVPSRDLSIFIQREALLRELTSLQGERIKVQRELERKREDYEQVQSGFREKQEMVQETRMKLRELGKQVEEKLARNASENRQTEESLDTLANSISLPPLARLFEFLAAKTRYSLDHTLLSRQLDLVEQEESHLVSFIGSELSMLDQQIQEAAFDKRKTDDIRRKRGDVMKKRDQRLNELAKWKSTAREVLKQTKEKEGGEKDLKSIYSFTAFERLLGEVKGNNEDEEGFRNEAFEYFARLETQEFELRELERVREVLTKDLPEIEMQTRDLKDSFDMLRNQVEELERMKSGLETREKNLDTAVKEHERSLEKMIAEKTKEAFRDYMEEQAETFEKIAKTYGKSTSETLEKQHRDSFLTLFRSNEFDRLSRLEEARSTCEHLEYMINSNMKTVDEVLIPSLKDLLLRAADLKTSISEKQAEQARLVGQEDELLNALNAEQEIFRKKVREAYENETDENSKKENEIAYILVRMDKIREEVARDFQDINEGQIKSGDLQEIEENLGQFIENLENIEQRLGETKNALEEIRDKQAKFAAVKQKLQVMSKQRKFLEQEVNLLVQGSSTNPEIRAKSVPKKGQNLGSYTDRVEKQMDLSVRAERKPNAIKSESDKRVLATESREPDIKCRPDCTKHQKRYRFNVETASFTEIELFDDIKSLLEGIIVYKKFSSTQSLKQPVFDPRNPSLPPESCGYGLRLASLNLHQDRLEFKSQSKLVESSIKLPRLFRTQIAGSTLELLKIGGTNKKQSMLLPFSVVLEEGGRVELIARSEKDLKDFVRGVNAVTQNRKELERLKEKMEVSCY